MDQHLISLARAVKRRHRARHPTLWLFSDARFDILAIIPLLPRDIAGIVFRHDAAPDRSMLARRVARLCRAQRIPLIIAGDWRLAAACRAGLHLRGGRSPRTRYRHGLTTASAHDRAQLAAATKSAATIIFLSPAFATASHPAQPPLGAVRWAALARRSTKPVLALGGIAGRRGHRLGTISAGFGAISALAAQTVSKVTYTVAAKQQRIEIA